MEVSKIVGSVDRHRHFDLGFLPTKASMAEKWKRVDRAFHRGMELPPVRLYKLGEVYLVQDGNHRVSLSFGRLTRSYGAERPDLPLLHRRGLAGSGTPCAGGRSDPGRPNLARHERKGRIMNTGRIQREDEAAMRQVVQNMQDAQNTKDGELFASAFAQEHDYMAINGMFLANQTRQDNARVHQRLYDESRSSLAGKYLEVEVRLNVSKIRVHTAGL